MRSVKSSREVQLIQKWKNNKTRQACLFAYRAWQGFHREIGVFFGSTWRGQYYFESKLYHRGWSVFKVLLNLVKRLKRNHSVSIAAGHDFELKLTIQPLKKWQVQCREAKISMTATEEATRHIRTRPLSGGISSWRSVSKREKSVREDEAHVLRICRVKTMAMSLSTWLSYCKAP